MAFRLWPMAHAPITQQSYAASVTGIAGQPT
jgi:hypothetical protein